MSGLLAAVLALPALALYPAITLATGLESVGIPVPGETILISAALLALPQSSSISVLGVFLAAVLGAAVGDNVGYALGRRYGDVLLDRLQRRFPTAVTPQRLDGMRALMGQHGFPVVAGGRFVALLRMLAGPLAGSMRMPYPKFFLANLAGAAAWAGLITGAVALLGVAAERWIKDATWVIAALVVIGFIAAWFGGRRLDAWLLRTGEAARQGGESCPPR
ncbi:DedA family protein [Corynebacterium guangdongense]|uniref:Membrane protein DedA with SNARE-associated domain n=1 Tax=Corynebacterium guangdongense TaxID=1783348 RepID=A0ABU1ZZY5_9CORY|nr:DedA family protein [Corynebacterium guangdongense]MDR7330400.1 membrane protein DedA with SNARE-associated domain [Corynebacterium guangdongense]WJZ18958.1 Inner membrane protein YohD [Corynebacterium guangdongense]